MEKLLLNNHVAYPVGTCRPGSAKNQKQVPKEKVRPALFTGVFLTNRTATTRATAQNRRRKTGRSPQRRAPVFEVEWNRFRVIFTSIVTVNNAHFRCMTFFAWRFRRTDFLSEKKKKKTAETLIENSKINQLSEGQDVEEENVWTKFVF